MILLVGFAGCILSNAYFSYAYRGPAFSVPRPSEGRVYPIQIGGFVSYVNEREFERYDFAIHKLMWPEFIIFAMLLALRISVKQF
jgi:hypothetical protein